MSYKISFTEEKNKYKYIKEYNKRFNFDSINSYINTKEINEKYIENPKDFFGHVMD